MAYNAQHPEEGVAVIKSPPKKPKKMRQGKFPVWEFMHLYTFHAFLDIISPGVWEEEVDEIMTMEKTSDDELLHHLRW